MDMYYCYSHVLALGVIDSDYRGTIHALYDNVWSDHTVLTGDRIAQGIIVPIPKVEFEEVEELSTTERGEGGFGSTGV